MSAGISKDSVGHVLYGISLWTTCATLRSVHSGVRRCLSAIRRCFCVMDPLIYPTGLPRNQDILQGQLKRWISGFLKKKAKNVLLSGKVMAAVFWYLQYMIYIDYLKKGQTVTGLIYAELLLSSPTYFPDLAPRQRDRRLGGLLCRTPENICFRWFKNLEHRCVKYIELKRDYVEKQITTFTNLLCLLVG